MGRKRRRSRTGDGVAPHEAHRRARLNAEARQDPLAEATVVTDAGAGLARVLPYHQDVSVFVKGRWIGRTILDVWTSEFSARSRDEYTSALQRGDLRVLTVGVPTPPSYCLAANDVVINRLHRHEPPVRADVIRVLANTPEVIVVCKPASMPVHPTGRYRHNTLIWRLARQQSLSVTSLFPVYRLDRLTSGVLVLARSGAAAADIAAQITAGRVAKLYLAVACGHVEQSAFAVDVPVNVDNYKTAEYRVDMQGGKPACSLFRGLAYDTARDVTLVACRPLTGRTHQLRLHLAHLGHSISNDPNYGPGRIDRQARQQQWFAQQRDALQQRGSSAVPAAVPAAPGGIVPTDGDIAAVVDDSAVVDDHAVDDDCAAAADSAPTDDIAAAGGVAVADDTAVDEGVAAADSVIDVADGVADEAAVDDGADVAETGSRSHLALTTDPSVSHSTPSAAIDPSCGDCAHPFPDPDPCQLQIYLHAWEYRLADGRVYRDDQLPSWAACFPISVADVDAAGTELDALAKQRGPDVVVRVRHNK